MALSSQKPELFINNSARTLYLGIRRYPQKWVLENILNF
jgi:hypothetical protein